MFFKPATLFFSLAILTAANPVLPRGGGKGDSCNNNQGNLQCCNSVQKASSLSTLLGLLNIVGLNPNTNVGVTCSPLTVIGLGGNECSQQATCCSGNNYNGVAVVDCNNIDVL